MNITSRIPEIYLEWTNKGRGWPIGSITSPTELAPILPLCMHDELSQRIPDALLSGQATVNIIQSCIPSINNAWFMPAAEIIPALRAIHIASKQEELDIKLRCSKCENIDNFSIDLSNVQFNTNLWYDQKTINDLIFKFKSPTYFSLNKFNIRLFQNQKKSSQLELIQDEDIKIDEAIKLASDNLDNLIDLLSNSIESISDINYHIISSDISQINEFLRSSEKSVTEELFMIINIALSASNLPDVVATCSQCQHEFKVAINLDFSANFRSRIINLNEKETLRLLRLLEKEAKELRAEIFKIVWFMRGGISVDEAMLLTDRDRELIGKQIKENLEITKKSGISFF